MDLELKRKLLDIQKKIGSPSETSSLQTCVPKGDYPNLSEQSMKVYALDLCMIERGQNLCRGCKGEVCRQRVQGFIPKAVIENDRVSCRMVLCRYERNRRMQARLRRLLKSSRIPARFKDMTFEDYEGNSHAVRLAKASIRKNGKGLLLYGERGTGKTMLAALVAKAKAEDGQSVVFASVPDLLEEIKNSFDKGSTEEVMTSIRNADCLVLDDMGTEKMTEFVSERLFLLINYRYGEGLQTIVTTNYSIAELMRRMSVEGDMVSGQRLVSRLVGMCNPVKIEGRDRRIGLEGIMIKPSEPRQICP